MDNNHPIIRIIEEDHHSRNFRKITIHIVEIVNIKITIQDQIETNLNFRLMPVPIQILEKEIIRLIDLKTLQTIDLEKISTIGIETNQIIETLDIK